MKSDNEWKWYFTEAVRMVLCAVVGIILAVSVSIGLIDLKQWISDEIRFRPVWLEQETASPYVGVGRNVERVTVLTPGLESDLQDDSIALRVWCEDDENLPDWWSPESAVLVWEDPGVVTVKKDIGCPDWNVDTSIWGWNGHKMEQWELDLFSRVFYLEFWGASETLCEAGCDAILRMWESEYYGKTIGETLSAITENGAYAYETYPWVWTVEYDQEGLAWCREYCLERFVNGPVWSAPFFQKYCYPWWAIPCYEIDGIYFSTSLALGV